MKIDKLLDDIVSSFRSFQLQVRFGYAEECRDEYSVTGFLRSF